MTLAIDLRGERVWVVGAGGGGLGTAICVALARAGAEVVGIDRDVEALQASEDAVREAAPSATFERAHADALDAEALASLSAGGGSPPTGLVNVVGGLARERFASVADAREQDFAAVVDLNLRAAWLASQSFVRAQRQASSSVASGAVVNLTSIAGLQAMPFGAAYAAAKAGVISLTRTCALEWSDLGIRVNAIAAGSVHVPRSASVDPERDRRAIPIGRRGRPEDVAHAAAFLLSDLAAWITGEVLVVDGGASIAPAYLDDDKLPVFVDDPELRARLRKD